MPRYYTWRDIDRASARIANLLASLELPAGARVAAQTDKSVEALLLYLAVLRAGFVYLPLNTAYQAGEIEYFVGNAEPSVVVCSARNFLWVSKLAFKAGVKNVFTLDDDRSGSLLERAAWHSDEHAPAVKRADELAAILYTSGTTGRSKGAMLTHGNLLANARTLHGYWGWQPSDVLIHVLPVFHVHGLFVASHGALLAGAKMLWFNKFDPKATIAQLPRATVFMGVPTLYVRMLAEPALTREACASMRLFVAGSAPLLPETFEAWRERTGHTIVERYGMSETVMLTSNPYRAKTASAAPARSASRCPACNCGCRTTRASRAAPARSAASRSRAPTCSRATGACLRRRPRSSRPTCGSRPATSARSTSAASSASSAAART